MERELVNFYRDLANKIENGNTTAQENLRLGEYMRDFLAKDVKFSSNYTKKYMFLGWYIYNQLLE